MAESTARALAVLNADGEACAYYPVLSIEGAEKLPYSLKVLLENVLRTAADEDEAATFAARIVEAGMAGAAGAEVEFAPARVLFQDFTGVPVFVDFAVMREACAALGGDARRINPQVQCDLVIDHSVIADCAGTDDACTRNMEIEFARNKERYSFLKWAQDSFENVRIVPPGKGICHQLNIENFASVVMLQEKDASASAHPEAGGTAASTDSAVLPIAYFDTVVGTDSHTPTANGIGVLGWGVGGIEAEAAALGQPITTLVPKVIGVRLTGTLADGVEGMDVALTFAQMLREQGVVGCFVECFGPGLEQLSATQRACISNMTPEYGSTCTLFPIDGRTLEFLRLTGRSEQQVRLVEAYAKAQGTWHDSNEDRVYAQVIELDLGTVVPSMSGPSRPHDRFAIAEGKQRIDAICRERGLEDESADAAQRAGERGLEDENAGAAQRAGAAGWDVKHGDIAIAAVTSCTTATDPHMMLACGLLASKAAERGLAPKPWVKTIFAPGSRATELLLERAGLMEGMRKLGFATCGFGCMSCIGNSGPIHPDLVPYADEVELASVLSGNRNFEGRISPHVSQNYLMAPANVVAYALAGTVRIDMGSEPLGYDTQGAPVFLRDIMPTAEEVDALVERYVTADLYEQGSRGMFEGDAQWQGCTAAPSDVFAWDKDSTYVRRAPYFEGMKREPESVELPADMRVLALLGDFITTDHISPAGSIAADSPAARYLEERGVEPADFNTYGSRRGNHEVMMRGTFANVKLANVLAQGRKGGWTYDFEKDAIATIFDASQNYAQAGQSAIVLAGKMYGSGSSRDWAAKGPMLLGVRAVIAESFERIHRSNLIGMGILPLQFQDGQSAASLGLTGAERFTVEPVDFSEGLPEPHEVRVVAVAPDGTRTEFTVIVRIDTPTEGHYYAHGGILRYVIRKLMG